MSREMSPRDRKLTLAAAIDKLGAVRDTSDPSRWCYHAEETESWWSVTEDALLRFMEIYDETPDEKRHSERTRKAYEKWAEEDTSGIERGNRP